ncbi:hypothetical protein PUNSTDRAFT_119770 [Punctularia strigosozonata HHB-11173 SS5]|uniref:uncharacterized protein n=1 Tax=Punctularia strigosozonata (strain HHB-11173) TaxID=741275 RepID=UPI00044163C3|nr:uncharacterized protein PUNSTDRAFT_119770 [Punctularia strigosozonata HHB-11173 SS5]EIN10931.1 hypothetical protein PUNSTDRAFT_119770 [Punctularia strigosozonata HHB-11173 SS5]
MKSFSALIAMFACVALEVAAAPTDVKLFVPMLGDGIVADAQVVDSGAAGTAYAFSIISGSAPVATGTLVEGPATAVLLMDAPSTTVQVACALGTGAATTSVGCGMVVGSSTSAIAATRTANALFHVTNKSSAQTNHKLVKGAAVLASIGVGALAVIL